MDCMPIFTAPSSSGALKLKVQNRRLNHVEFVKFDTCSLG
jgi:hypothetical protein